MIIFWPKNVFSEIYLHVKIIFDTSSCYQWFETIRIPVETSSGMYWKGFQVVYKFTGFQWLLRDLHWIFQPSLETYDYA